MKLTYTADHVFRYELDGSVAFRGYDVDYIHVEAMWVDATPEDGTPEGGQPEGWWITGELRGWPLTAKGKRDKRVARRERVWAEKYPAALWSVVGDAWTVSLAKAGIDASQVVNPGEGLFNPANWEPQPADVLGGRCIDCNVNVTYEDTGFWPWVGADDSIICVAQSAGSDKPFGHRLHRDLADQIFATHYRRTGTVARHR